jgi:hypothetical protein
MAVSTAQSPASLPPTLPPLGGARAAGGSAAGAAGAAGAAASVAGSAARFALGSSVVIVGLKAKPQLNGQAASVLGWDETKGRYNVSLSGGGVVASGGVLALKPENLSANLMQADGGGGGGASGGGGWGSGGGFGDFGSAAPPL